MVKLVPDKIRFDGFYRKTQSKLKGPGPQGPDAQIVLWIFGDGNNRNGQSNHTLVYRQWNLLCLFNYNR